MGHVVSYFYHVNECRAARHPTHELRSRTKTKYAPNEAYFAGSKNGFVTRLTPVATRTAVVNPPSCAVAAVKGLEGLTLDQARQADSRPSCCKCCQHQNRSAGSWVMR